MAHQASSAHARGLASLLRFAPAEVLAATMLVIWARALKAGGTYLERMLVLAEGECEGEGEGEGEGGGEGEGVGAKLGELRTYSYSGGTLQGHNHLATEARESAWVCFVPTATRGDKGGKVVGFAKLVACEPTGWATWAEAARHAGSGISHAEAKLRDRGHPIKDGDELYLWRLEKASVTRCTPFAVQRAFSAVPGPMPLHLSAKQLLEELPDAMLEEMVLTVVPFPLTAKRARGQADPKPGSPLSLRASQQQQRAASESESEGENVGEEEEEGEEGAGEGQGALVSPPPTPPPPFVRQRFNPGDWTPVQRKGEYAALLREHEQWKADHPGQRKAIPKRTSKQRRRVPTGTPTVGSLIKVS